MLKSLTIFGGLIVLVISQLSQGYETEKVFDIYVYQGDYLNQPNPRASRGNHYGYSNSEFFNQNRFTNYQQEAQTYHQPFHHRPPPPRYHQHQHHHRPPPPLPPFGPHFNHNHMPNWHNNGFRPAPSTMCNNNYYNTESTNQQTQGPPIMTTILTYEQTPSFQPTPTYQPVPTYKPVPGSAVLPEQNQSANQPATAPSSITDVISEVFPNYGQQNQNLNQPATPPPPSRQDINDVISGVFPNFDQQNFNQASTVSPPRQDLNNIISGVFPNLSQQNQNINQPTTASPPKPDVNDLIAGIFSSVKQPTTEPLLEQSVNTLISGVFQGGKNSNNQFITELPSDPNQSKPPAVNTLISGIFSGQGQQTNNGNQPDISPPLTEPSVPFNFITTPIPVFQPVPVFPTLKPKEPQTTSIPVFQPEPVTPTATNNDTETTTDDNNDPLLYDIDIRTGDIEQQPKT